MEAGNFTNVEPGEFNQFPSNVKPGNRNEILKKKRFLPNQPCAAAHDERQRQKAVHHLRDPKG